MLDALKTICEWRQANPVVQGDTIRTDSDSLANVYRGLESLTQSIQEIFSRHAVPLEVRPSRGQSFFPNIPYVAILPPGQKVSNGVYVVICFDRRGLGVLAGCIESVTNRKGIGISEWPTKGSVVDVDGGRPTTKYNKAFFNPREFLYPFPDIGGLKEHLEVSADHAINFLRGRENSRIKNMLGRDVRAGVEDADFNPGDLGDGRRRIAQMITSRRGQSKFRGSLLKAYNGRCAVTGCGVEALLEAAHIMPYKGDRTNHVQNGLLLRADIHLLFDMGLIAIDPKSKRVLLSPELKGSEYQQYVDKEIHMPESKGQQPSADALEFHKSTQFQYTLGSSMMPLFVPDSRE